MNNKIKKNMNILWEGPSIYIRNMNYGMYGRAEVCSLKPIYCTKVVSGRDIKENHGIFTPFIS